MSHGPKEAALQIRVGALEKHVVRTLALTPALRAPIEGEREPTFSGRVLAPALLAQIEQLGIGGLRVGGDGAAPVAPIPFVGRQMKPDLTVTSFARKLVAVEVKYVHQASTLAQISRALGQALLYRELGFMRSVAVLIDSDRVLGIDAAMVARSAFASLGVALVVRQRLRARLMTDEAWALASD